MRNDYYDWLESQGYADNTCATQMAHIRQIEKYYGDLEAMIADGELERLVDEFTYTKQDERDGKENPTKVDFSGRTYTRLQSLKGAIRRYASFLDCELSSGGFSDEEDIECEAVPPKQEQQRFALERDMQTALRDNITSLENGLFIVDDGAERSVDSGFIDILCEDQNGHTVVVELKAGKTDSRVVGQILGYMGDLIEEGDGEDVRGIIVAHSFDKRTVSAARAVPNLQLKKYAINFVFEPHT